MRRVYIVLSTAGVGGAEKRFTDNWCALRAVGMDVHLVMDHHAHAGLCQQPGLAGVLSPNPKLHVLDLGNNHYRRYCAKVNTFFASQPERAIVHYPLAHVPRVQANYGHRMVVSWVNSAMPPLNFRGWRNGVGAWLSFITADHIDVLNPNNLAGICRVPGMYAKTSLTAGGTQIDASLYRPGSKALDVVFLGRAEAEKQALRLVSLLPQVHHLLQNSGHRGYRFLVCGEGSQTHAIRALMATAPFQGQHAVPMQFGYSPQPAEVLGQAAVFLSLQRTSNYPSKALAEAMACGAYPILTDVGESAMMVDGLQPHSFVPRDFTAADLAGALRHYLNADAATRARWVGEIANFATARFANGRQAAYFGDIYRRLGST